MRKTVMPVVLLVVMLTLTACGNKQLSATDILLMSAEKMGEVDTVQFTLERVGEPVMVDLGGGVSAAVLGGSGEFKAPADAHALVKVELTGFVAEADVLWTNDLAYYKVPPLISSYTEIELPGFDLANVFVGDASLATLMRTGLDNVLLAGEEDLDGQPTYLIQASAQGEVLQRLMGAALIPDSSDVALWINRDTFEVVRAIVTDADGNSWQLDLFAYGEPVEIPSP